MSGIDHYTKQLLHCNGASASTLIPDATGLHPPLTTAGGCALSTATAKFGSASITYGGAGASNISQTDGGTPFADLAIGANDFTVDFWLFTTSGANQAFADWRPASTAGAYPTIYLNTNNITYHTNNADRISGGLVTLSAQHHIALTRAAGNTKLWLDGTQTGSTFVDAVNYLNNASARPFFMGSSFAANQPCIGFMDEIRVSIGIARWNAPFTPPTAPYSKTSGFWI
jgi:hypothetical protein